MSQENQTIPEIDLPMNAQTAKAFAWIGWGLVLVGTVNVSSADLSTSLSSSSTFADCHALISS